MTVCFLCNKTAIEWYERLSELKSAHSATTIREFIKRFLNESKSGRNVDDQSNCICAGCFEQISFYDLYRTKRMEQETKLKRILLKTEAFFTQKSIEIKVENGTDDECHSDSISVASLRWADSSDSEEFIDSAVSKNESKAVDVAEVTEPNVNAEHSGVKCETELNIEEESVFVFKNEKLVEANIGDSASNKESSETGSNTATSVALPAKTKSNEISDTKFKHEKESPGEITSKSKSPLKGQEFASKSTAENDEPIVEAIKPKRRSVLKKTPKTPSKPSKNKSNQKIPKIPCRMCEICNRSVSIKSYRVSERKLLTAQN